jgi:hypothetical protein
VLQPTLYALAVEALFGGRVHAGRLWFATARGGYVERLVPLDGAAGEANRRAALDVLQVIDRALARGFLPAAPVHNACAQCDFATVCGPHEDRRTTRKIRRANDERLQDLTALREMR